MVPTPVGLYLRRSLGHVRHVEAVRVRAARGPVAAVYRQVERDFGAMAPPVGLHSPSPEALAAAWAILRETLVARGTVARADKELVATAVSAANGCPYCADVHGMTMAGLAGSGRRPEHDTGELRAWAEATATAARPAPAPFTRAQTPEILGTAVTFHYYNRMVNVFLGDSPLPPHVPDAARPRAERVLSRVLRPARRAPEPGSSLRLLPSAPSSEALRWARPSPVVEDAFARAYAAADAAGSRSVPDGVRALVAERLAHWDGGPPGVSRSWASEAVAELPAAERAAGELALVIALAAYQVDDGLVQRYRRTTPGDRELVELAAWASMAAARRVGTRLAAACA